jgi:O-antigen/teichoic acid export membrane protein
MKTFRQIFVNQFYLLWVLAVPAAVGFALFARQIVILFYDIRVVETCTPLAILAISLPLSFLQGAFGTVLNACHRQHYCMKVNGILGFVFVVVGWPVMVRWGAAGGALTVVAYCTVSVVAYLVVLFRLLGFRPIMRSLQPVLVRIGTGFVIMLLPYGIMRHFGADSLHPLIQMAIAGGGYIAALLVTVKGRVKQLLTVPVKS